MGPALRPALGDLVHRYAAYADQRRLDDLAGLFAPDGELVLPDPPERLDAHVRVQGRRAIGEHLQVLGRLALTVHQVVGEVYDGAGARSATGRVACVAHHVSGERDVVWHLHYDDRYTRQDDTWLFARRELHIDLITVDTVRLHR